jgi:pimeloyl-ACP methyl ester carboxylesterase
VAHEPAADPGIDCFYIYPTVSRDPGTNSDMVIGPEETNVVYNQAARLNSTCRVFAPMYRQVTLAMIGGGGPAPAPGVSPFGMAYGDVVDAFKDYIATKSDGRGFVLIGHSQGSRLLSRLIQDEIDDEPLLRDRLVAAYLLGFPLHVPEGEVVGGDPRQHPAVRGQGPDRLRGLLRVLPVHPTADAQRAVRPQQREWGPQRASTRPP